MKVCDMLFAFKLITARFHQVTATFMDPDPGNGSEW